MGILAYEIWHIKQPSNMPAKGAPILKDSSLNWNYLNMYLSFGWAKLRMSAFLCAGIYLESETGGPVMLFRLSVFIKREQCKAWAALPLLFLHLLCKRRQQITYVFLENIL